LESAAVVAAAAAGGGFSMTKLPGDRMSRRFVQPDLSEEDRRTYRAWARRFCLIYSAFLLVLLGVGAASDRMRKIAGEAKAVEAKWTTTSAGRSAEAVRH
jgi:hypothetical protein